MAVFIHLFDERNASSIRKNGIKISKNSNKEIKGVFAYPQTENFVVNHQWMRELRRRAGQNILAARFRISDNTEVLVGKYNEESIVTSASNAIGIVRQHIDPMGLEVIVTRPIKPREIISIYKPPKVSGWRYYPNAKGEKPCGCPYCQRGEPYSKKLRIKYEKDFE